MIASLAFSSNGRDQRDSDADRRAGRRAGRGRPLPRLPRVLVLLAASASRPRRRRLPRGGSRHARVWRHRPARRGRAVHASCITWATWSGCSTPSGSSARSIVGHDWGAPVAWNAALLRPDRFPAVAALSVPYSPRGSTRPTEGLARAAGAHFMYMLYFQAPGVAEAELERDVRDTIRACSTASRATRATPPPGACRDRRARRFSATCRRRRACRPGSAKRMWTSTPRSSRARASAAGSNWYRNLDRTWELMAAWQGAPVTVPALFVAGERDPVIARRRSDLPRLREIRARAAPVPHPPRLRALDPAGAARGGQCRAHRLPARPRAASRRDLLDRNRDRARACARGLRGPGDQRLPVTVNVQARNLLPASDEIRRAQRGQIDLGGAVGRIDLGAVDSARDGGVALLGGEGGQLARPQHDREEQAAVPHQLHRAALLDQLDGAGLDGAIRPLGLARYRSRPAAGPPAHAASERADDARETALQPPDLHQRQPPRGAVGHVHHVLGGVDLGEERRLVREEPAQHPDRQLRAPHRVQWRG